MVLRHCVLRNNAIRQCIMQLARRCD